MRAANDEDEESVDRASPFSNVSGLPKGIGADVLALNLEGMFRLCFIDLAGLVKGIGAGVSAIESKG